MKRGILFSITLITWTVCAPSSYAYTQAQENVLNNLADAISVARTCKSLKINEAISAAAMIMHGLREDMDELLSRVMVKEQKLQKQDKEVVCLSGEFLYGANGYNIKNLLVKAGDPSEPDIDDSADDMLSEGGRFAKFIGIAKATERNCPQYRLKSSATDVSHLDSEDVEAVRNLSDGEQEIAEKNFKALGCKASAEKAVKYRDFPFKKVWDIKKNK